MKSPSSIPWTAILSCALLACLAAGAHSQTQPAPAGASSQAKAKTPVKPSVDFTFQQRIRTEDWNNILDMNSAKDDERRQMRYRSRFWFQANTDHVIFKAGMVDEITKKYALKPADVTAYRFNNDEAVIEYLSIQFPKFLVPGLSVSVGRQDIQRGEGFVLWDGTSGDGSRTIYFNAALLSYVRNHNTVELMGMIDPRQDRFLGIVHDQHKYMNEWDEQAVGLYWQNRQRKDLDVDGYYFYKKEIKDYRAATHAQYQPDRHISTLGARAVKRYAGGLSVVGEYAEQWGGQHANATASVPAKDIHARGGYGYAKKSFATVYKPYVQAGYWALSGGKLSDTTHVNDFDPIFSRWPKWSELTIYTLVPEHGVAYWTNNQMVHLEVGATPIKKLFMRTTFYETWAFHPFNKNTAMFGTGTHRGENYQFRSEYTFNPTVKAHVLYENFLPGSFYAHPGTDSFFFQAQVQLTFAKTLGHKSAK